MFIEVPKGKTHLVARVGGGFTFMAEFLKQESKKFSEIEPEPMEEVPDYPLPVLKPLLVLKPLPILEPEPVLEPVIEKLPESPMEPPSLKLPIEPYQHDHCP